MQFQTRCIIKADHPSLAGHFPGAPIVPGVVLLDEIEWALRRWKEGSRIKVIQVVKFLQPIKPEQPFTISFTAGAQAHVVEFSCRIDAIDVVHGRCEIASAQS